ncbi:hypothetical protein [Streptomyces sp. APSN-46.1]|uniref:hypothetical protein n=1 Tax=Streptomyces sp. APSN-46.1 TaxID=2929049 RepID=UPI0035ABAA08
MDGSLDTGWYDRNHYLLIATDAHDVAPAIDGTRPTEAQARDRLGLMAAHHASVASADWYPLPSVLATWCRAGSADGADSDTAMHRALDPPADPGRPWSTLAEDLTAN